MFGAGRSWVQVLHLMLTGCVTGQDSNSTVCFPLGNREQQAGAGLLQAWLTGCWLIPGVSKDCNNLIGDSRAACRKEQELSPRALWLGHQGVTVWFGAPAEPRTASCPRGPVSSPVALKMATAEGMLAEACNPQTS